MGLLLPGCGGQVPTGLAGGRDMGRVALGGLGSRDG